MRAAGFSLTEMLVVLAIVGLATAAVPRFGGPGTTGLVRATAEQATAALREARTEARRTGQTMRVVFDTAQGSFRVEGAAGPARHVPAGALLAVEGAAGEADEAGRIAIRFDAEGGSTGGRVRIALRDAAAGAEVDWMTGHVRVLR